VRSSLKAVLSRWQKVNLVVMFCSAFSLPTNRQPDRYYGSQKEPGDEVIAGQANFAMINAQPRQKLR